MLREVHRDSQAAREFGPAKRYPFDLDEVLPWWSRFDAGDEEAQDAEASRIDALRELWTGAGLKAVETREITVQRTFADFDDFWTTSLLGPSVGPTLAAMTSADVELLKARVRARLPADTTGRITYGARANAVKGYVPN